MFRHLELLKRKKKEELAQVSEPVSVTEEPEVDIGRRGFLRGMAATAAVAAMPTVLQSTEALAGKGDRLDAVANSPEASINNAMAEFRAKLSSPAFRETLAGRGGFIRNMLGTLKRFDYREVKGTKYDFAYELYQHAVQFGFGRNAKGGVEAGFIPASAGPSRFRPATTGYGNGFFWNRKDVFMTAQHVYDAAHGKSDTKKKCDMAVIKVNKEFEARPEQIIHDDTSITDADVHGAFVSIVGIDNDATALKEGPVGCKVFSGGAVRLTREWVDAAFPQADQYFKERLYRSFMIEVPKGEAEGYGDDRPIAGMSGAPAFMLAKDGRKVFAGMFHASYATPDKDLAFFFGPEMARQEYSHAMRNVS